MNQNILDRLWARVEQLGPDECWPWLASKQNGYGQINVGGVPVRAHRLVCEIHHGAPMPGQQALHSCDNPGCCNPKHLRWGSISDNMRDRRERNTIGKQVLTREQVEAIRSDTRGPTAVGQDYGISRWQVTNIRRLRQWT